MLSSLLGISAIAFPTVSAQATPPAPDMWITGSPNPAVVNDYQTITVRVDNGIAGETVALDQKVAGLLWSQIATEPLDGTSFSADFSQHWAVTGNFLYRARVVANANHTAATSSVLTLSVVTTLPPPPTTTFTCDGQTPSVAKPGGGSWGCTYNDEFDEATLDTDYWHTPELGYMPSPTTDRACYGNDPDNVWVSGGVLHLQATIKATAKLCPGSKTKYSRKWGAQVWNNAIDKSEATTSQTYGYYEVKATLPARYGTDPGIIGVDPPPTSIDALPGLQSTFYLWPNSNRYGEWPDSGEIDFAEFYSKLGNTNYPATHWKFFPPGHKSDQCNIDAGVANTYKFLWSPGHLTAWVNNNPVACFDQAIGNPFDNNFFLILNNAFGDNMGTWDNSYHPAPGESGPVGDTQIEYVRIWQ